MAITDFAKTQASSNEQEEEELNLECRELLLSLPKEKGWRTRYQYQFQGFSIPKTGTTWLKALAFAVLNRNRYSINDKSHPLLSSNSHDLVPFFEYKLYTDNKIPNLNDFHDDPRLFATHIPFASLPESIKTSDCRIVYICRNPLDTFISSWHFIKARQEPEAKSLSLEEAFNMYCKGIVGFGPFWEHMLGYWRESQKRPNKVLFLTYEDMKANPVSNVRRLAKFLGQPFTVEEERGRVTEEIVRLCSFEKMKDLEVNKSKKSILDWENKHLFRKGEVGDWVNYLSQDMVEELAKVVEEKLGGSGLDFKVL